MRRICETWLLLVCLGYVLAGCDDLGLNVSGEQETTAEAESESDDAQALTMIRDKEVAEAKAWLAQEQGHVLWKGDRGQIKQLVDRLYAAGVPQVYAAGISKEGPTEIVAMFMAELPADKAARDRVFDVQAKFWKSYLDDPDPDDLKSLVKEDQGQKYLIFNFDL
jgi:hypothetical protein